MPLQPNQMPGQVRARELKRGTRIPKLLMAKQEVGTKHTNTGINLNLINMNAIAHKKKIETKKPEIVRQRVLKPIAQAYRSQVCMFSVDGPQETVSPSATTPGTSGLSGSRMNTIFSSHNWGNSK